MFYTPAHVARYIVQQTLSPLKSKKRGLDGRPLRILDPACGDGVFLCEAYRWLRKNDANSRQHSRVQSRRALVEQLFGIDVDADAVEGARRNLARVYFETDSNSSGRASNRRQTSALTQRLNDNVCRGNALVNADFFDEAAERKDGDYQSASDWHAAFSHVLDDGGFDAVIGNPPYVNMRWLTKQHGAALKDYFRGRYRCARGAYDLYALFIERAFELLRPGGYCGFIVPNKLATLDYALPCRALLIEQTTIEHIVDAADLKLFGSAGVYPYIVIWRKSPPSARHRIRVSRADDANGLDKSNHQTSIHQRNLSPENGFCLDGALNVESRVRTVPLSHRATLHSGTTGFTAQATANKLIERDSLNGHAGKNVFDFIVSGNIDRYCVRLGDVRFMKRRFARPVLMGDKHLLTDKKRALYQAPKIVIAGMTRRLEAAWDDGGLALGVQVYAAADPQDDPRYLLGLLNSRLLSYLFRIRFAAKRLAGGYLAINKGQLERLPIRAINLDDSSDGRMHDRMVRQVEQMLTLRSRTHNLQSAAAREKLAQRIRATDQAIDLLVYQLYELSAAEIARVDSLIDGLG